MNLDLTTITNIIPFFFKLGLFTFVFHLIYNCCCEKMEIVKEDKVRYALKINYVLMLSYLIISIAIYALITFRVIILFIFSFGLLSLLGIQNFRPDLSNLFFLITNTFQSIYLKKKRFFFQNCKKKK